MFPPRSSWDDASPRPNCQRFFIHCYLTLALPPLIFDSFLFLNS